MPQGNRWFLMKVHLNAPLTTARAAAAGLCVAGPCVFCSVGEDSIAHLAACGSSGTVLQAYDRIRVHGRLLPLLYGRRALLLQDDEDGATRTALIAFFAAACASRGAGHLFDRTEPVAELARLIDRTITCPWLTFCPPTLSRKQRRALRVTPPDLAAYTAGGLDLAVYRADGACQDVGDAKRVAGHRVWLVLKWPMC